MSSLCPSGIPDTNIPGGMISHAGPRLAETGTISHPSVFGRREDLADPAVRIIRYAAQRRVELLSRETGT